MSTPRTGPLLSSAAAVTWTCPPSGEHVEPQPAWMAFTGQSASEMLGSGWTRAVHPDDLSEAADLWRQAVALGRPYLHEHRIRRHDGEWRWMSASAAPVTDASGAIVHWVGINIDITDRLADRGGEREWADRAQLEQERQRFAALIDQSNDLIGFAALDGRALYVNRATTTLLGLPPLESGTPLMIADLTAPEDQPMVARDVLPRVLAGEAWRGQLRVRHFVTGEVIPTEQVIFPLIDPLTGTVAYIATIARDGRERIETERRLRQSESEYRLLFDASAVSNAEAEWPSTRITRVNARFCDLLGYDEAELLGGMTFADVTHPDDRARTAETLATFMNERRDRFEIDKRYIRKNGEVVWVHLVGTRSSRAPDGSLRLVGSAVNITDRRRAEELVRDADQKKNEFLAVLAHELRNPLAPIRNSLQIMQLAAHDPVAVGRARAVMSRQVEQMTHLVDDLMDVSRISQGRITVRRQRMRLADAVRNAIDSATPLLDTNRHTFTVDLPTDDIWVDGDVLRLSQVFTNILNNAAKYTPPGGVIRLTVRRDNSEALVIVEDNGIGIPTDMLGGVFEMFVQVDRANEVSRGGLGLGLHIAKRLVAKHGGTIAVESDGVGHGSRFTVRLPVLTASADTDQASSADAAGETTTGRRILVVDDNVDAATSLTLLLDLMGHRTQIAHDGQQAISLAESFQPDVILMDIGMPGLSGYDVCRRIRATSWGHHIVIIAQTGWGNAEDRRRATEAGFNSHLTKPIDPRKLEQLLAELFPAPSSPESDVR